MEEWDQSELTLWKGAEESSGLCSLLGRKYTIVSVAKQAVGGAKREKQRVAQREQPDTWCVGHF